tara:strand:+ start:9648 stop:10139 length:492 start_codon:yes stop_codon:yes gene_type:complete
MRIIVLLTTVLIISCGEGATDYESLMVDRAWLEYPDVYTEKPYQSYYNSKDSKVYNYYRWEDSPDKGEDFYKDFIASWKLHRGTPGTNPMTTIGGVSEGWEAYANFKFDGNNLVYQTDEDIHGKNLITSILERGQDTTIGIFKYNKVYRTTVNNKVVMLSKIE